MINSRSMWLLRLLRTTIKLMTKEDTSFQCCQKLHQFSQIPSLFRVTSIITNIERHGRFAQLIKSSKRKRNNRIEESSKNKKEQDYMNCIEQQEEEIENLKEELKDAKSRLENHSRDTDLLKKLYDA